jgi:hypothetical protein
MLTTGTPSSDGVYVPAILHGVSTNKTDIDNIYKIQKTTSNEEYVSRLINDHLFQVN